MNQRALAGFVKIVELNSFSAAAEALYLSRHFRSRSARWKDSCSLNCFSMCRAG